MAATKAGEDGKPDFRARKSCNYLTDAVEDCGNKLIGDCNTEEQVNKMKDNQIRSVLLNLQSSVQAWDSSKCPTVQAHIDRMKAAASPESEPESEPEPSSSGGLAVPLLLLSLSILLH